MAQITEIMLGTKYVDRKNPKRIGEVIEVNEKAKTVTLQFEDGTSRGFVVTTLNKTFKVLDEVEATESEAPAKDAEDVADQPKTEESAEKAEEAEPEKEAEEKTEDEKPKKSAPKQEKVKPKKKSAKVDNSAEVKKLVDFIFSDIEKRKDCSVGVPRSEDMKFRALRVNNRQFCKLMWSGKGIRLYFRCDVNSVCPAEKVNYNLPYLVIIDKLTAETKKNITGCFKAAIDFELASKKEDKKSKKAEKVEAEKPAKVEAEKPKKSKKTK